MEDDEDIQKRVEEDKFPVLETNQGGDITPDVGDAGKGYIHDSAQKVAEGFQGLLSEFPTH